MHHAEFQTDRFIDNLKRGRNNDLAIFISRKDTSGYVSNKLR